MLDIMDGARARIDAALQSALWAAVATAGAGTAVLFLLSALFIGLAARYDALTACLVLGGLFLLTAAVAALAFMLVRRSPRRRVARADAPGFFAASTQDAAAAMHEAAADFSAGLGRAVQRRPLAALALVLGAGFVLGVTRSRG